MTHQHWAIRAFFAMALVAATLMIGCRKSPAPTPELFSPLSPVAAPTQTAPGATLTFSDRDEIILFMSDLDGSNAYYIMDPDGSNLERLGFPQLPGTLMERPRWFPELQLFLGAVRIGSTEDMYFFDTAGAPVENLTGSPEESERDPLPSPAHDLIAYTCVYWDLDICVVKQDGTGRSNLTDHPARDSDPAWHPSGERLVFVSNRSGIQNIFVMSSTGEDLTNLTSTNQPDVAPSWSPDGEKILFQSQRGGNWDVYVMDGDGRNTEPITSEPSRDTTPAWSPDGKFVAFLSDGTGANQLYVVEMVSRNLTELTNDLGSQVMSFAWSPDGHQLVYTLAKGATTRLERINVDGRGRVALTDGTANAAAPVWFSVSP